jgi:signal transduction histidine kinase
MENAVTNIRRAVRHLITRFLGVIVVLAAAGSWQAHRLVRAEAWIDHTDEVIGTARLVQQRLTDQEAGARAYSLTGDPAFRVAYARAGPALALDALARLVKGNGPQLARVEALREGYRAWRGSVEAALAGPVEPGALGGPLARQGDLAGLRALLEGFIGDEEALRRARVAAAKQELLVTEVGGGLALVVACAALAWVSRSEIQRVVVVYEEALRHRAAGEASVAAAAARERAAREEAEAALRLREEFLWTLSHELRTPLTAVLGWVTLLRSGPATEERLARGLLVIERNARAETRIVDDLIDQSDLAKGQIQLALEPATLDDAVVAALEACRGAAGNKGVDLVVVRGDEPAGVLGDPPRLQQVAWNLIANGIKFTPRGGHVEVHTGRAGDQAVLRVRDDGQGIGAGFLPHVFAPFRQADGSMTRAHGGLGLGLSIVKHLVELHGGTVAVESPGAGQGATFTVSLPAGDAVPRPPEPARPAEAPLRGVRVLVVEDDPEALAVVESLLRACGAEVRASALGQEALAILASRERVDLLVADLRLPDLDGCELLQRARAAGRSMPALALTACVDPGDVERARCAGFARHVGKPYSPEHLVAQLAEIAAAAAA